MGGMGMYSCPCLPAATAHGHEDMPTPPLDLDQPPPAAVLAELRPRVPRDEILPRRDVGEFPRAVVLDVGPAAPGAALRSALGPDADVAVGGLAIPAQELPAQGAGGGHR